ncbi:24253_t:CDS:2, partial [Dentiscutata erythropus]
YSEKETHRPHIYPGFTAKSHWILSEEMKRFNEIARIKRIEFINAKFINKTSLGIWHLIPVILEEANCQKNENSLKKPQILLIINSLVSLLGNSDRSRFHGLLSKSCDDSINIL